MKPLLQSFAVGLAGVLAGLAVGLLVSQRTPTHVSTPPTAVLRTYSCGPSGWTADAPPAPPSHHGAWVVATGGYEFTCSDGSVLLMVRVEYDSPASAMLELERRLEAHNGSPPTWPTLTSEPFRFGHLVQFSGPTSIEYDRAGRTALAAFAIEVGSNVILVYGPSRAHVVELLNTQPCPTLKLW